MKTLRYAQRLVGFDSTSQNSNRLISKYLEMKLTKHGFLVEQVDYQDRLGTRKVNLVAKKGNGFGGLAYFSHTDVVPANTWFTEDFGPFDATVVNDRLYGRGSCDMKGSIACMLAAAQRFDWHQLKKPLYFVCTADEEVGFFGIRNVIEHSKFYREMVDHGTKAIIGEPTNLEIVHAHKGSCRIIARATGRAGHSSEGVSHNSNLAIIPFAHEMLRIYEDTERTNQWQNNEFEPPSLTWNIGLRDDSPAMNVTAANSVCTVYVRPMPGVDIESLLQRTRGAAERHGLSLQIVRACEPLWVDPNSAFVTEALQLVHRPKSKSVSYATDGGLLGELSEKIVFGPGGIAQAHTHDEWISLEQLARGTELYEKMIQHWCCR